MPLVPPPTNVPNMGQPDTFPADADDWVYWEAVHLYPFLNALLLSLGPGAPWCEVGGTANALTLTTDLNLEELVEGQAVIFVPSVTNTGAATATIDGTTVAMKTCNGAALPAGYLRAGWPTCGQMRGGQLWCGREDETGSWEGGDGKWTKEADGTATLTFVRDHAGSNWTTSVSFGSSGNAYRGSEVTLTFPFDVTGAAVAPSARRNDGAADVIAGATPKSLGTSSMSYIAWASASIASGSSKWAHMTITGRWY